MSKLSGIKAVWRLNCYDVRIHRRRHLGKSAERFFPYCLFTSPGDTAPLQIIWTHLYRDLIARKNFDIVHPEFSGDMRQDGMSITDIHLEHGIGQGLDHGALQFYHIIFRQGCISS